MKRFLSVIIAVIFIFTLTACNTTGKMSVKEITTHLTEELDLNGFTNVKGETLSHYFGFKSEEIKSFSFLVSEDDSSSNMMGAFEYKNADSKKLVIDGIANYFAKKSSILKDNVTAEYTKIQNRLLFEYQNIIVLVVCDEAETAKTVLNNIGAQELK